VPPAGFEPARAAPEAVSLYSSDLPKRARRDLVRARIGRSPPTLRSAGVRPAFRLTLHDRHPNFGEARSPAVHMGATLSRRWPSGAVPNRLNYAQTRRLADARIWLPSVSRGWLFPPRKCAPVLAVVKQTALDDGCGPAWTGGAGSNLKNGPACWHRLVDGGSGK